MNQRTTIIILALLTVGSYLLLRSVEKTLAPQKVEMTVKEIAVARNVKGRYFDNNHHLKYVINSEVVKEYSNQAGKQFEHPTVWVLNADQSIQWNGASDLGILSANKNQLILKQNVQINRLPNNEKPTHITGESFYYLADKDELFSDLPVRINDGISNQVSKTFKMDTKEEKIDLRGSVRATYIPLD